MRSPISASLVFLLPNHTQTNSVFLATAGRVASAHASKRNRYGLGGGDGRGLGVGACLGVGVGRGVVVGVTVAVAVGVGVRLGVAVGVGVGPEGPILKAPLAEELFWKRMSLATIRTRTSGIPVDGGSCQS